MALSILTLDISIECHHAHYFLIIKMNVIMLSVIMLSVIMLSVIMLSVIMLSVIMLNDIVLSAVAPFVPLCHCIYKLL